MPSPAQTLALQFPIQGMDITTEYGLQPDLTSPLAKNVRSYDPETQRNRGGARCGISRYIDQQLPIAMAGRMGVSSTGHLIQHLAVIVDPTIEATLSEFYDDYWWGRKDGKKHRRMKLWRRRRGSGVRPRKQKNEPSCQDDTLSADVGGAVVESFILANDAYNGTPTVSLGYITRTVGGTVSLLGPVGGWRVSYTPPEDGAGGTVIVPYRLTASGNSGRDYGTLTITVDAWPPASYPRSTVAHVATVDTEDGYIIVTFDSTTNGFPSGSTAYKITANGPGTGGGDVDIFIENISQLDGIIVGSTINLTVSGTYDTGYAGVVSVV